jgi:hypothetical protein
MSSYFSLSAVLKLLSPYCNEAFFEARLEDYVDVMCQSTEVVALGLRRWKTESMADVYVRSQYPLEKFILDGFRTLRPQELYNNQTITHVSKG